MGYLLGRAKGRGAETEGIRVIKVSQDFECGGGIASAPVGDREVETGGAVFSKGEQGRKLDGSRRPLFQQEGANANAPADIRGLGGIGIMLQDGGAILAFKGEFAKQCVGGGIGWVELENRLQCRTRARVPRVELKLSGCLEGRRVARVELEGGSEGGETLRAVASAPQSKPFQGPKRGAGRSRYQFSVTNGGRFGKAAATNEFPNGGDVGVGRSDRQGKKDQPPRRQSSLRFELYGDRRFHFGRGSFQSLDPRRCY